MDRAIIKKTRLVGDIDKIHSNLNVLCSTVEAEVDRMPEPMEGRNLVGYIYEVVEPKVKVYVPQFNLLIRSLLYSYLLDKKPLQYTEFDKIGGVLSRTYLGLKKLISYCLHKVPKIDEYTVSLSSFE